jgi:cytochrome P450
MKEQPLTADDPRYKKLFDVSHEAASTGGSVYGDLTPQMSALRNQAPVQKGTLRSLLGLPPHDTYSVKREHYTLFSYKACQHAFVENLVFSSEGYKESPGVQSLGRTILEMVGDEHRRYRQMVQPMFLRPKAASWWKPKWIEEPVKTLIDNLHGKDRVDLNMDLCARLPMYVVSRGIGIRGEDALTFRDHLLKGSVAFRTITQEERIHSMKEVGRMLKELITARRAEPADDVVSVLIQSDFKTADGGTRKLTDEEIFAYCRLIILAGGGTTWRQLGITLHALMTHYEFWEACRDKRELIDDAVYEAVRWCPTDPIFTRLVTQDVELEGVTIPAGIRADVCLGAANRDPARWSNPDAYDIFRPVQAHLGFASGPHQCLGMNVAKQEMITAINGLMDRYPNMRLDPDAPKPELLGGLEQRGMSAVPVVLK